MTSFHFANIQELQAQRDLDIKLISRLPKTVAVTIHTGPPNALYCELKSGNLQRFKSNWKRIVGIAMAAATEEEDHQVTLQEVITGRKRRARPVENVLQAPPRPGPFNFDIDLKLWQLREDEIKAVLEILLWQTNFSDRQVNVRDSANYAIASIRIVQNGIQLAVHHSGGLVSLLSPILEGEFANSGQWHNPQPNVPELQSPAKAPAAKANANGDDQPMDYNKGMTNVGRQHQLMGNASNEANFPDPSSPKESAKNPGPFSPPGSNGEYSGTARYDADPSSFQEQAAASKPDVEDDQQPAIGLGPNSPVAGPSVRSQADDPQLNIGYDWESDKLYNYFLKNQPVGFFDDDEIPLPSLGNVENEEALDLPPQSQLNLGEHVTLENGTFGEFDDEDFAAPAMSPIANSPVSGLRATAQADIQEPNVSLNNVLGEIIAGQRNGSPANEPEPTDTQAKIQKANVSHDNVFDQQIEGQQSESLSNRLLGNDELDIFSMFTNGGDYFTGANIKLFDEPISRGS